MKKFYTGVGSRHTPQPIQDLMSEVAAHMASLGWVLRSGGCAGADRAFERGSRGVCAVYRPEDASAESLTLAADVHPNWPACNAYARRLHGRNVMQVLGRDLKTPSRFVICWTRDGCVHHDHRSRATGGTGTAISIASLHQIQVFNLARPEDRERVERGMP